MWEQTRDQRRALVGFAAGGDVAVTAEGQEIRGAVVGGAEPRQGQPVLVTGTAGNWTISGLELEPFAADTPLSTPQLYDRKGCGKCWTLAEFGSMVYALRWFNLYYLADSDGNYLLDENGNLLPTARFVDGRLESVKYPTYGRHLLAFLIQSQEPCLQLRRPTGVWMEGRLSAPPPVGARLRTDLFFWIPDEGLYRHIPTLENEGDRLRVRWTGIPQEGVWLAEGGPLPDTWFNLVCTLPLDADTLAITELEVCLGSQGRARVTSEQ